MVESSVALDLIFGALADVTRRDILKRVSIGEHTVSELAEPYAMSLAAIAKHGLGFSAIDRTPTVKKCLRAFASKNRRWIGVSSSC